MNHDLVELTSLMDDVHNAYQNLDARLQKNEEIESTLENLSRLHQEIVALGFCDEVKDKITHFESIENLVHLSAEKIIQYTATESVGEAVKEGVKKFWEGIKAVFIKIMEFFAKTFNTVNNKCREIVLHLGQIDVNKEVLTMTKDGLTKLLTTGRNLEEFMNGAFKVTGRLYQFDRNIQQHLLQFVRAHSDVLVMENSFRPSLKEDAVEFKKMTLDAAGWKAADCGQIAKMFAERTKNHSKLGAIFITIANGNAELDFITKNNISAETRLAIRTGLRTEAFMYGLLAKIQTVVVKQIITFYKCIGDAVSINPDYKEAPSIGYQPA